MYFNNLSILLTAVFVYSYSAALNVFKQNTTDLPHQGCKYLDRDRIQIQEKLVGRAYEERCPASNYRVRNELGATSAKCSGGFAGGYPCDSVDLLSIIDNRELSKPLPGSPRNARLNDIWGWTDPTSNREFVLVGLNEGIIFVEVTDPVNPVHLGGLPTATTKSNYRDIKTIGNYAVIGSEAKHHGLQIFDLMQLTTSSGIVTFSATASFNGFGYSHNVFAHEDKGFVYAVGSEECSGGLYAVDMNDPLNPSEAGCFSNDGYTHDVHCVTYNGPDTIYQGKEICFASNEDTITIVDVTDKSKMVQLSKTSYGDTGYTHQGWLTENHSHFIFNDELDERHGKTLKTRTHIMDVSDLNKPSYTGYHDGRTCSTDHNLYVLGDYVYQANYRAGLNVLKIKNVAECEFEEAGYFDIYPESDNPMFNGAWSNYPFFPSGIIVMSGIEQGLFVLKLNKPGGPPTASPVTAFPTSSDDSDDGKCSDNDFFYHKNVKTCSWLAGKSGRTQEKYCKNYWKYHIDIDGRVYGPPHVECPKLCHLCDECNESKKHRFYLQEKKGKPKLMSCKWLKNKKDPKSICNKGATNGVYPSADVICPQTCMVNDCGHHSYHC